MYLSQADKKNLKMLFMIDKYDRQNDRMIENMCKCNCEENNEFKKPLIYLYFSATLQTLREQE